jgi:hypothetical protein
MKVNGLIKVSLLRLIVLRLAPIICGMLFVTVSLPTAAHAVQYMSESYATNANIPIGSIVSLKNGTNDQVVAANNGNVDNLLGVVVNPGNSVLSVNNNDASSVEVATNGIIDVLVSDINGTIVNGDQITASPIDGVGMEATSDVRVIGIAQSSMDSMNSSKQTYTDQTGAKKTVMIGQIPVQVSVSYFFKEPDKTLVPAAIQNLADTLAGKTVSTLPIVISIIIFIVTLAVVVSIIYTMVRSSIISVGRNPMSQSAIYRDIIQLSALVLAILSVGMISIYLVLTRM